MVSIMPGMENFAPERTLTSSGFSPLPNFCPWSCSSLAERGLSICASTSAEDLPWRMYSRQASVWMVKPGGTGRPGIGHFGQTGAFAAEIVLHFAVAVGFARRRKSTRIWCRI